VIDLLRTEKECIEYIHSLGRFGKKAGLCNIKALLNALGNPHRDLKCIHIAGTNGKGSVSCMLTNILVQKGFKVGMNTSPYIEVFNERLTINGQNIPAQKLIKYTNLVADIINSTEDLNPIEFEVITAIGFLYFKEENCDWCVIECGIGGLMDSTNVISKPELCVITPIGFDHTGILGETIADIACQKAGIIKRGAKVAIHPDMSCEALSVIEKHCTANDAQMFLTSKDFDLVVHSLEQNLVRIGDLNINLNLLGSFQPSNAALAVNAARCLGVDDDTIIKGIENASWKCRFERVKSNIIIDGAHNHHGIKAFRESVQMYLDDKRKVIVVGILNDKDFGECAKELALINADFIVTDVPSARQLSGEAVYERLLDYIPDASYEKDYTKALEKAKNVAGKDGFVCVVGSLYLAGAVRSII